MLSSQFFKLIEKDLGAGFIETRKDICKQYSLDWTKRGTPKASGVVRPRSTEELSSFLKHCFRHRIKVVPSGGRTGLAGGALASQGEIVLSLERMNRIGEIDVMTQSIDVQAGAITEHVIEKCKEKGFLWPIDLAAKGSSQIGGNISTNAGGVRVLRYGMTREWVSGVEVVLMDGRILTLRAEPHKNNTGYDLKNLFIGSEGTLGVVTSATLKLTRVGENSITAWVPVRDMKEAFQGLKWMKERFVVTAFEFMCEKSLMEVREKLKISIPVPDQAGVLLEFIPRSGDSALNLDGPLEHAKVALASEHVKHFWAIRESISEAIKTSGCVYKFDFSVPLRAVVTFYREATTYLQKTYPSSEVFLFGHLGDGNLHMNMRLKKPSPKALEEKALWKLVKEFEGSVAAEHGIGLFKKASLGFSKSKDEIELYRKIKRIFDPRGLLNPGKVIDL